jgi:hypothetical protein
MESVNLSLEKDQEIFLKVTVKKGAVCRFSYSKDDVRYEAIGEKFKATQGRWIGAKVGIFCINPTNEKSAGYADFDWVRITK